MKARVNIEQKTVYTNYKGEIDNYTDTLRLEFDSLSAAKDIADAFPESEIADIEVVMTVTLKDRNEVEDGEGQ